MTEPERRCRGCGYDLPTACFAPDARECRVCGDPPAYPERERAEWWAYGPSGSLTRWVEDVAAYPPVEPVLPRVEDFHKVAKRFRKMIGRRAGVVEMAIVGTLARIVWGGDADRARRDLKPKRAHAFGSVRGALGYWMTAVKHPIGTGPQNFNGGGAAREPGDSKGLATVQLVEDLQTAILAAPILSADWGPLLAREVGEWQHRPKAKGGGLELVRITTKELAAREGVEPTNMGKRIARARVRLAESLAAHGLMAQRSVRREAEGIVDG